MNTERWAKLLIVSVLAAIIFIAIVLPDERPFFPKTMRLQNDVPQVIPAGVWTPCNYEYVKPGDGVLFYPPSTFTIDPKYTGALLTVNVQTTKTDFSIRFVGEGGVFDRIQVLGNYNEYASATWPIEAINDQYRVEVFSKDSLEILLCRISVQINR